MYIEDEINGLDAAQIREHIIKSLPSIKPRRVLLIPPDITRSSSGAGLITSIYYELLTQQTPPAQIDILPALGTHAPMTRREQIDFFGEKIPAERYLVHDWRNNVTKIGEIPGDFVCDVSEGLMNETMDLEISNYLLDSAYDLIISIGQVVPHEVVGMANYTKNIVVGCGGSRFISSSHMLGAFYGLERIMGKDYSPVRKVFDYAQDHFLSKLDITYVLTVTDTTDDKTRILGLYTDKTREGFNRAVALSRKHNLNRVVSPIQKCVVYLDEHEYHSTWLGNKAIYRSRMAMADGGELIILAPGVRRFGEDSDIDRLIRKYGYIGRENILKLCKTEPDLQENLSAAAHLIHGSSDGRFSVTYATTQLCKDDIEGVGYKYMPLADALKLYTPDTLKQGINTLPNGEEIYYISNPALGLWVV